MFTKATITNKHGVVKKVVSFGPLCVLPDYQRKGYGTALLNYAFTKTLELGYDTVIIYGNPENYICHGFRSCCHYHIHAYGSIYPTALLVKELKENAIDKGECWSFHDSPVFNLDPKKVEEFDKGFPPTNKEYKPSQELFYIYSHSHVS